MVTPVKTHSISLPSWFGVLSRRITVWLSVQPARCSRTCLLLIGSRSMPMQKVWSIPFVSRGMSYCIWNMDHALKCYWTAVYRMGHSLQSLQLVQYSTVQDCSLQRGDSHPPEPNFLQNSVHNRGSVRDCDSQLTGKKTQYTIQCIYNVLRTLRQKLSKLYIPAICSSCSHIRLSILGVDRTPIIGAYYC